MSDSTLSRWADRRLPVMLALGFAAGAPLPLVAGQVLRQWFTESGLSLGAIGLTALIGLAYACSMRCARRCWRGWGSGAAGWPACRWR
jgi:MFS transporter, PAT family, beta-lactamase induction signal transducer AmpG